MSKYMLSDEDSIDKINPYVQHTFSLPGAIGKPHPFEEYEEPLEPEPELLNDNTHICETGITSGDKVVETCRPSKVECRLSRPLIPGRNIDMGVDEKKLVSFETVSSIVQDVKKVAKSMKTLDIFTIVLIVLIILTLSSVRR
jgi:hypothetical protein